jgi:transcriptional regulator with XRE-family HTH domain
MRSAVDSKAFLVGIGAEVRRRRNSLDLSQTRLAQLAHVHVNVIGRLERGIYNVTVILLCRIAAALDTSIVELLREAAK